MGPLSFQDRVNRPPISFCVGAALFAAALFSPSVSAGQSSTSQASKLVHLSGVVEGPTHPGDGDQFCSYPSKLNLREGEGSVGVVHIRKCLLKSPTDIRYHGWVKLRIGGLSGKLRVSINFYAEAQGQLPYGEGFVTKVAGKKRLVEGIKVKRAAGTTPIPTHDGAELEVLLKPSGRFPPR